MTTTDGESVFPLTTVWSSPASCPSSLGYIGSPCDPPNYSAVWVTADGYYSPGICFNGYTSGCDMTWRSVEPDETAVICVPSGWNCSDQFFATTYDGNRRTTSTVPAFEIRWVKDDLALFETDPLRPGETFVIITAPEPTSTSSENKSNDEGDEDTDTDRDGGVPAGVVAGIAVGAALFVAILFAAAFIWYRKRHIDPGKAAAEDVPDGDKLNDESVPPGASQEMLGDYQFPGPLVVPYPNATYTQPTQMMPLYQFPPGNPPLIAQPYGPPPGISHELAGAYVQAQADISELHAVSRTPTSGGPEAKAGPGTQHGEAQTVDPTKVVGPMQSSPINKVRNK